MKMSAEQRNQKISGILSALISNAKKKKEIVYPKPFTKEEVETLFMSHIWGHREITLTIILARMIDPEFQASENFYECNPRSIYEKPIRELLRKNNIPHKKSGPLNVAKNSQKINETWAHNKRGDGLALVVAELVKKIESVPASTLEAFAFAYVQRYLLEAKRVAKLKAKVAPNKDPLFLTGLCLNLINDVPDGGAIPQYIVGLLMNHFHSGNRSQINVTGYLDSVSATNTTSKKAGDVSEEFEDQNERIYEVTVKSFSADRMMESYESIKDYDKQGKISEVFVICRLKDVPEDSRFTNHQGYLLGKSSYQDMNYYYINIDEWVVEKLLFTTAEERSKFFSELVSKINENNTSEKVKVYFREWLSKHSV